MLLVIQQLGNHRAVFAVPGTIVSFLFNGAGDEDALLEAAAALVCFVESLFRTLKSYLACS